jgi:hypothetical protein
MHNLDRFKQRRVAIALVCVAVVIAGLLLAWVAAGRPFCGTHVREGDMGYWGCSTDPSPYGPR